MLSILSMSIITSCESQQSVPGNTIKYKVSLADISTKGELVNDNDNGNFSDIELAETLSPFYVAAFNGGNPVFKTSEQNPAGVETVSYADEDWTMTNVYFWPQKTSLKFFAYGNLPESGSSVTIAPDGQAQTLTHALVPAVADQKDILLGYYNGYGSGSGIAEIRFKHPLTAVYFKVGNLGTEKVKSITLSGLGKNGNVVMGVDGTIGAWAGVTDYTGTSTQSEEEGLSVNGTTQVIGDPFILIPQDLTTNKVKLVVEFLSGLTLETTIESGKWQAGKTNIYTLRNND